MAATINSLPTEYRFEYLFAPREIGLGHSITAKEWHLFNCIDLQTGRKIRSLDTVQVGEGDKIGRKLCTLSPALVRKADGETRELVLKKADLLVQLDHPLGKTKKRKAEAM